MTQTRSYWAVEVLDPNTLSGRTLKFPFAYREHAELWARDEEAAAKQLTRAGIKCRVFRATVPIEA